VQVLNRMHNGIVWLLLQLAEVTPLGSDSRIEYQRRREFNSWPLMRRGNGRKYTADVLRCVPVVVDTLGTEYSGDGIATKEERLQFPLAFSFASQSNTFRSGSIHPWSPFVCSYRST
jgi:hypothetical protein